ncbi:MAG: 50S ribosomal protein L15 [Devosiaceae bacterium]|nr:50S ribosomal protein L15 [Devosiaceae bacterium MH13]
MKLNEIANKAGAVKAKKRVGRGIGSGKGKTSGRGVKGQKARSGVAIKGFEGGQMPMYRRLPKRGFNNPFSKEYSEVNVGRLQQAIDAGKLDAGTAIDGAALVASGVITKLGKDGVRLLGNGELTAKVEISVAGASKGAVAAVEKAGGNVHIAETKAAEAATE